MKTMSEDDTKALSEAERALPYQLFDREDEKEIIASLKGAYIEGMVYQFKQGGRIVTGVSYTGIKEIAYNISLETGREINTEIIESHEDENNYYMTMRATHKGVGSRLGAAVQSKTYQRGGIDPFAYTKILSKAQRNALRSVLPENALKVFLEKAKESGKIKDVTSEQSTGPRYFKDDRGSWRCEDVGIDRLDMEVTPAVLDVLSEEALDITKVLMGKYGDNIVIYLDPAYPNLTVGPYRKAIEGLDSPKLISVSGNKSSHWTPIENLPAE